MATAKTIAQEHDSLVKELLSVQQRYIDLLNSARENYIAIEFRVLDAPNSVWMNTFPNHEWDISGELYRIQPFSTFEDYDDAKTGAFSNDI